MSAENIEPIDIDFKGFPWGDGHPSGGMLPKVPGDRKNIYGSLTPDQIERFAEEGLAGLPKFVKKVTPPESGKLPDPPVASEIP